MNEAFATDWKAIGLPDHSPFDILSRPRAQAATAQAPKKRGPKPRTTLQKTLATLNNKGNTAFNPHILTREEADRTQSIKGATC